jgi:hypothetical protein
MEYPAIPDFLSEVNANATPAFVIEFWAYWLPDARDRRCDRISGLLMPGDRCWQL